MPKKGYVKPNRAMSYLKVEAARIANKRGHRLRWSLHHGEQKSILLGTCRRCGDQVSVSSLGTMQGEALEQDCKGPGADVRS